MTYLVTGGSGFIGSHLIEKLLKDGHSVINIDNFDEFYDYRIKIKNTLESLQKSEANFIFENKEKDLEKLCALTHSENYQLYTVDIRDKEALQKIFCQHSIDLVIHLAALAGVRPSIERPKDYSEVNIGGTMNIWEVCKEFNIKKTVCASSSSVYGNNPKVPFSEEDQVDHPISPYAAAKRCCEVMGHVYHHLYNIDIMHLRFFTVYGPRQRPDLAIHKFTKHIHNNTPIPFYGDGSTARDYTFVEDIIDGVTKAIKYIESHEKVYEIINLGESEVITLSEMVAEIEKNLNTKAIKNIMPMQPGDVIKTNANITKAKELLGYNPSTNFQNGIKNFVEWFLRN